MKHFNKLIWIVALFVTMGLQAQNLLVNGDFESWDDDTSPTGWTKSENITKESTSENVHGGSFSAKHSANSTKDLSQTISITPYNTYVITIWYKVESGDGTDARIYSYWKNGTTSLDANATELRLDDGYFDSNTGTWSSYSTQVTAPADADNLYFEVRSYGSAIVYWDDLSVIEVSSTAPSITNITVAPEDVTSSDAVTVSATVTDDGVIVNVGMVWGLTTGSTDNQVLMSNGGSGDVYTATIPAQADGSTIYFTIGALDNNTEYSTSVEMSYVVRDPSTATLPYTQEFDTGLGDFYTYSVSGDTKEWNYSDWYGYAAANGYNSGDEEIDYLITPGFDLTGTSDEVISYKTWRKYGVESDADNFLKLYYSTDYAGMGDPSAASWTEITGATFPVLAEAEIWTKAENVDVSMADGKNVHFAFVYKYSQGDPSNTNYVSWEVDSIVIKENPDNAIKKLTANVGVASYAKDNLKIFSDASFDVAVYSLSGVKVKEVRNVSREINVADLTKGVYMVTLIDGNGAKAVRKFIKQ